MRAIIVLLILLGLMPRALAEPVPVRAFEVILSHEDLARTHVGKLTFLGGLDLRSSDARFGGFSGLDITPDGRRLIAISDRANWLTADLRYGDGGQLTGLADVRLFPALGPDGKPFSGRKLTDAESIARLTNGALIVGFEQAHRLQRFSHTGAPATDFGWPPVLRTSPPNGGAEAVTRLWGNQLLVLSEGLEARPGVGAGWIGTGNNWRAVGFQKTGIYRPVGAATGRDGTVYILERRFSTLGGIGARISRVHGRRIAPGAIIQTEELAELSPPLVADNFEGIAVRREDAGRTLLYIISDDNFHDLQRTLLLMFALAE